MSTSTVICGVRKEKSLRIDIEVLSHAFTKAIEWGLCEHHPIRGKVRKNGTKPRTRYIEDWEIAGALKVASPFLKAYIKLKLLTGLRRGDLLSIKMSDLSKEGIYVKPRKTASSTGKEYIIEWSDALRAAVDEAISIRRKNEVVWLFHTNRGRPYVKPNGTAYGFCSIWQRFMNKCLANNYIRERFTEHDIRAKVASDSTLENASLLLGHSNSEITKRVYRRKIVKIQPTSIITEHF